MVKIALVLFSFNLIASDVFKVESQQQEPTPKQKDCKIDESKTKWEWKTVTKKVYRKKVCGGWITMPMVNGVYNFIPDKDHKW